MIDADFVNAIEALSQRANTQELVQEIEVQPGQTFVYRSNATDNGRNLGDIIMPPQAAPLSVTTLTGFRDAISKYVPETTTVHVESSACVSLIASQVDAWGRRATYVTAKYQPLNIFSYDRYYDDLPMFIVHLQSAFLQTDNLLYVIRIASNLKSGNTIQTTDDGFSQTLVLKRGEVETAEVKVAPRIKLIPVRSFPEAAPVESEFLIRFKQNGAGAPTVALFDCDGGKWKGEQMAAIKTWLSSQIDSGFAIIA